jgi:hypothetical protein
MILARLTLIGELFYKISSATKRVLDTIINFMYFQTLCMKWK